MVEFLQELCVLLRLGQRAPRPLHPLSLRSRHRATPHLVFFFFACQVITVFDVFKFGSLGKYGQIAKRGTSEEADADH